MCLLCVHLKLVTVQAQEHVGREECDALVSIDEGVVHDERFEQRCCHLSKVRVIAGAGSIQCAFQKTVIAYAFRSAEAFQQGAMDFQDFVAAEKGNGFTWQAIYPALRFRLSISRRGRALRGALACVVHSLVLLP